MVAEGRREEGAVWPHRPAGLTSSGPKYLPIHILGVPYYDYSIMGPKALF